MQSLQKKNEFIEQMCSNLFRIRQQTFACHARDKRMYTTRERKMRAVMRQMGEMEHKEEGVKAVNSS